MSEVFLARPLDPRRYHERYALKRLLPELARAPNFIQLFDQERALAERLEHPNVVRVVDGGMVEDRCFMVIEYVEGLDGWKVTRRLARQIETLPLDQVLWIVTQALSGLAYLHELRDEQGRPLGIVHRDVSPSNILISRQGEVKVGDFGIALISSAEVEQQRRQRLRGKIRYLSPEQIRNQPLDARSDLFAVGVLLAELIIGRTPFRGQTDIALLLNIRDVRLHLAEDLDERTPAELREILMQALARDPQDRPASAAAMRDRLLAFAAATVSCIASMLSGARPGTTNGGSVKTRWMTSTGAAPAGRWALIVSTAARICSTVPDAGFQMSNSAAVRRRPASLRMPESSGGCGCCNGLGDTSASRMVKNSPSKFTGSGPQQAFNARTSSSIRRPRVVKSTSIWSC
jgi:serine/threonine protein kinase